MTWAPGQEFRSPRGCAVGQRDYVRRMSNHIWCEYPLRTIVTLPPGMEINGLKELKIPDPLVKSIRAVLTTETTLMYNVEDVSWGVYVDGQHLVTLDGKVVWNQPTIEQTLRERFDSQIARGKRKAPAGWTLGPAPEDRGVV
jgi:hypothetical protein